MLIFSRLIGSDHKEYLACFARKEIEWIQCYGKPVELDFPHNGVFPGVKSPADYIPLIDKYLALTPFLLPENIKNRLNQPILRHPGMCTIQAVNHSEGLQI